MNANSVAKLWMTGGAKGVAAHAGLFVLGGFADSLGLGAALSAAFGRRGERAPAHDRGTVLTHGLLMLAGGGESCSDIEHLRAQPDLFGDVASDSTLYRALRDIDSSTLAEVWAAAADVRARVWHARNGDAVSSGPLMLDVDSTLVEVHTETKQGAAPHYKGGFGFGPMLCATGDGEPLWIAQRPGNAAANNIANHLEVLDGAIAQPPAAVASGHRPGDDAASAHRDIWLRADSAGCSKNLATALRDRNVVYLLTARSNEAITAAIATARTDPDMWRPAARNPKQRRCRAQVAELTASVDLAEWPTGTRLIVRREPFHPGAQRTLFESSSWRYWGLVTDAQGHPVELDKIMRQHARVADTVKRLKDSGLARMPFTDWNANAAWTALTVIGLALVAWFQQLRLHGDLAKAAPKTLRWQLWHTPARITRSGRRTTLQLPERWPAAKALLAAHSHN
ncbi:IS1380 family transposase [Candidatus Poriferisodalis sp.]|uniref:IS1380 family transposase n=1 Tax=Candidatus Poriferisodalis sp. TaxID=3101277 RepID=UPI003C6F425F